MPHVFEDFSAIASRIPDAVAVEFCHRHGIDRITFGELAALAGHAAATLAGLGVGAGDRCAILAENHYRWLGAYLGALRLGAVPVPLDTAYDVPQVRTVLRDSGARVLIVSPRYLDVAREAAGASQPSPALLLVAGSADGIQELVPASAAGAAPPPLPACPATESDPAVMLYTSGTTSDPKGVVLTHGNLRAEREGAFRVVQVDERDAILAILPLFHALAQIANLLDPADGRRPDRLPGNGEQRRDDAGVRRSAHHRVLCGAPVLLSPAPAHLRAGRRVGLASPRRLPVAASPSTPGSGRLPGSTSAPCSSAAPIGDRRSDAHHGERGIPLRPEGRPRPVRHRLQHRPGLRPDRVLGRGHRHASGRFARRHRGPSARGRRNPHRARTGCRAGPRVSGRGGPDSRPDRHGRLP